MQKKRASLTRNSPAYVWVVMAKATHAISKRIDADLKECNLSNTDFRILEALLNNGPLAVNVLGPKVGLTTGSISTAIDRLTLRGLVTREENSRDKRIREVDLTPDGEKIIAPAFRRHTALLEDLISPLNIEQRGQLANMLKLLGRYAADTDPSAA